VYLLLLLEEVLVVEIKYLEILEVPAEELEQVVYILLEVQEQLMKVMVEVVQQIILEVLVAELLVLVPMVFLLEHKVVLV